MYRALISHPLYLAFVSSIDRMTFVARFMKGRHFAIQSVEHSAGFSPFPTRLLKEQPTEERLDKLVDISRAMSANHVGLQDAVRHLKSVATIVEALDSENSQKWSESTPDDHKDAVRKSHEEVVKATFIMRTQIETQTNHISFQEQRARAQLNVVRRVFCPGPLALSNL